MGSREDQVMTSVQAFRIAQFHLLAVGFNSLSSKCIDQDIEEKTSTISEIGALKGRKIDIRKRFSNFEI